MARPCAPKLARANEWGLPREHRAREEGGAAIGGAPPALAAGQYSRYRHAPASVVFGIVRSLATWDKHGSSEDRSLAGAAAGRSETSAAAAQIEVHLAPPAKSRRRGRREQPQETQVGARVEPQHQGDHDHVGAEVALDGGEAAAGARKRERGEVPATNGGGGGGGGGWFGSIGGDVGGPTPWGLDWASGMRGGRGPKSHLSGRVYIRSSSQPQTYTLSPQNAPPSPNAPVGQPQRERQQADDHRRRVEPCSAEERREEGDAREAPREQRALRRLQ